MKPLSTNGRPTPHRLFVYGTLAPGGPNAHILAPLPGTWQPAWVRGRLLPEGWGAAQGFPGLVLEESGEQVHGFLFSSDALGGEWARLDAFEGAQYQRVTAWAHPIDGQRVQAQVYALHRPPTAPR